MMGIVNIGEYAQQLDVLLEQVLSNLGIMGAIISSLLIIVESILPMLPLCVFITLIFYKFGKLFGLVICWICTCLGCFLSYSLVRNKFKNFFERKIMKGKHKKKLKELMYYINHMSLTSLALIVAIPFTPAFLVNIAAGLSNISKKKFITGILIGKLFMVYFWGYIGTTLIECLTHPIYLIRVLVLLSLAFVISKIINKYFNIE